MKEKRIVITNPEFLEILEKLKDRKFAGLCANKYCNHRFTFTGSFILDKLKPHIKYCLERKEKRGAYKWIEHICKACNKLFVWDIPIYKRGEGKAVQVRYELLTRKYLAPFNQGGLNFKRKKKTNGTGK